MYAALLMVLIEGHSIIEGVGVMVQRIGCRNGQRKGKRAIFGSSIMSFVFIFDDSSGIAHRTELIVVGWIGWDTYNTMFV